MSKIEIKDGRMSIQGPDPARLNGVEVGRSSEKQVSKRMRWKDGSYLTVGQKDDEEYVIRMGIA